MELKNFSKEVSEMTMKEYKRTALDALRGNWKTAIITGFVASLLGGSVISSNGGSRIEFEQHISSEELNTFVASDIWQSILPFVVIISIAVFLFSIAILIIGGAVRMGYASYNLHLIDGKNAIFHDLFIHMNRKWAGFCMNFFIGLYTALWSLLLVIPGIVKGFAYSMTPYIMAENPEMTANDAISESVYIMEGHKWDLFVLHLSFIGWGLLVSLPALIVILAALFGGASILQMILAILLCIPLSAGNLFLHPYMEAANAAFYRDITHKETDTKEAIPEIEA